MNQPRYARPTDPDLAVDVTVTFTEARLVGSTLVARFTDGRGRQRDPGNPGAWVNIDVAGEIVVSGPGDPGWTFALDQAHALVCEWVARGTRVRMLSTPGKFTSLVVETDGAKRARLTLPIDRINAAG